MEIAPSILTIDYLNIQSELDVLMQAGIGVLHMDVMDGHFVPNLSFGPALISAVSRYFNGLIEAHLMVSEPEKSVQSYIDAGCKRIIFHPESTVHTHRLCQLIKSQECEVGVVLNPATSLDALDYIVDDIDMVLIMTVNPGFGGQAFIPSMKKKIEKLVERRRQWGRQNDLMIEVDGGVKAAALKSLAAMGVDLAVVGSGVFNSNLTSENLRILKESL